MSDEAVDDRVANLLELSSTEKAQNSTAAAAKALREALALSPQDARVITAIKDLQIYQAEQEDGAYTDGNAAILSEKYIADCFLSKSAELFSELWAMGDPGINSLTNALLNQELWSSQHERTQSETIALNLLLTELSLTKKCQKERAMKAIARLLAADAPKLHHVVDDSAFESIAMVLDLSQNASLRSQATLAVAKFLEVAPERGQHLLTSFVMTRASQGTANEDLSISLSVASAMFPFIPKIAAELFLKKGFLLDIMTISERSKDSIVTQAALELLNASCVNKLCREAIVKDCSKWLESKTRSRAITQEKVLAGLILAKTSGETVQQIPESSTILVKLFQDCIDHSEDETAKQTAAEGLAYLSMHATVKDSLTHDQEALQTLVSLLKNNQSLTTLTYGCLTIFHNMTKYPQTLTSEQERIAQLKAYANQSKQRPPDPLEDDAHVTFRCQALLNVDIIPVLVATYRSTSPGHILLISSIALAISKHPKHRGKMAQQGCLKMALDLANQDFAGASHSDSIRQQSSLLLANILIPIDPNLIFSGSNSQAISYAIKPLNYLLTTPYLNETGINDLRPSVEALRALTNLAALNGALGVAAQDEIFRLCWTSVFEDKLSHHHEAVRRAATQLICNMSTYLKVREFFADRGKHSRTRIQQVLAFTRAEDLYTALAAGGAVAGLTADTGTIKNMLEWPRGIPIVLESIKSEDEGLEQRALAVVGNLLVVPEGKDAFCKSVGAKEALQELIKRRAHDGALCESVEILIDEMVPVDLSKTS